MDLATAVGLVAGFVVVILVMILDGGSPMELFSAPQAILLTVGGAITASIVSFSLKTVTTMPKVLMVAFMGKKLEPEKAIEILATMADKARREGLLALEEEAKKATDAFLQKGIMLVVDGVDPAQVRNILSREIEQMRERHAQGSGFLTAAGGFAPTMGIIGTVMGLINVLKDLSDPGKLGESIATAFLATLWGILTANLIWLPLAGKLKAKSEEEAAYRSLVMEGILSLQAGENPRLVREKLSAFLAPKQRLTEGKAGSGKNEEVTNQDAAPKKAKAEA
jgi:chemotaxis protein MotA